MARPIDMPAEISVLHPDPWTQPFWDAAQEHRLVVASCTNCSTLRAMPPGPICWSCAESEVEWIDLPGTGTVHTFTIVRGGVMASLEALAPFVVAVIDLDDAPGVRLMSNVVDISPDAVEIGMRVHVVWDDVDSDTTFPRFVPMDSRPA